MKQQTSGYQFTLGAPALSPLVLRDRTRCIVSARPLLIQQNKFY